MNELHLFSGAGGGILGGMLLGHTCVCAVEIEPYCRKVLLQRQRDGILPKFPIWDDVRTFDGKPWRGIVDVVCGGFPCQDISVAGTGKGLDGARSGLWNELARIICEVRPKFAFVENSPALVIRGLGRVLGDLAEIGMYARWGVFGTECMGAPHERARIFILAFDPMRVGVEGLRKTIKPCELRPWRACSEKHLRSALENPLSVPENGIPQPLLCRVDDGLAHRVDRTKAVGNGQVPSVVALAWNTLANIK